MDLHANGPEANEIDRLNAAREILRRHGLGGARIRAAGAKREIAAVAAAPEALPTLTRLAPELKALGFSYVALELTGREDFG